jgi:hypothetical protein
LEKSLIAVPRQKRLRSYLKNIKSKKPFYLVFSIILMFIFWTHKMLVYMGKKGFCSKIGDQRLLYDVSSPNFDVHDPQYTVDSLGLYSHTGTKRPGTVSLGTQLDGTRAKQSHHGSPICIARWLRYLYVQYFIKKTTLFVYSSATHQENSYSNLTKSFLDNVFPFLSSCLLYL